MFLLWLFCSSAWLLALINVVPGDILMFLCNFFIMGSCFWTQKRWPAWLPFERGKGDPSAIAALSFAQDYFQGSLVRQEVSRGKLSFLCSSVLMLNSVANSCWHFFSLPSTVFDDLMPHVL